MIISDNDRKEKLAKYIGNNIFQYRKEKKLTREQLAEKSNLSSNHIYELEMGNCIPTTITLNISLSQIIDLNFINNTNEFSDNFLTDFQKLTDKEKQSIIHLIKFMANN